jgi:4-hydroxy-4-methyl-2-oxoglutarate aldolase
VNDVVSESGPDAHGVGLDEVPLLVRLRRLDTGVVSDAMDSVGLDGVVQGLDPLWDCPAVAGRVIPVQLVPIGEAEPAQHHLGTAAVGMAGPWDVIVVDNRGRVEMGGWGGLLAVAAKARQISGVIVDGACRDADEITQLRFPVFARGRTARTARGRVVERPAREIEIGGIVVRAGDFVLADHTSIVFVPRERADDVITAAERIVTRETAMSLALQQGVAATAVMGLSYEQLLERIGAASE